MKKWVAASVVALPVLAASAVYFGQPANAKTEVTQQQADAGFVCPVTGEVLPCENCCQLNK